MALKVNYTNDVLDSFVNTDYMHEVVAYEDGSVSFNDVTAYSQKGSTFGAGDMNATNEEINKISGLTTYSASYMGISFNLYKVGRLVWCDIEGTANGTIAAASTDGDCIAVPAEFECVRAFIQYTTFASTLTGRVRMNTVDGKYTQLTLGYVRNIEDKAYVALDSGKTVRTQIMWVTQS